MCKIIQVELALLLYMYLTGTAPVSFLKGLGFLSRINSPFDTRNGFFWDQRKDLWRILWAF